MNDKRREVMNAIVENNRRLTGLNDFESRLRKAEADIDYNLKLYIVTSFISSAVTILYIIWKG